MAAAIAPLQYQAGPIGPLKDRRVIDISADDFLDVRGFVVEAIDAGDITYRTLGGTADVTQTLAAGDYPAVAGVPVLCTAVRTTSTVTTVVVGWL